FDFLLLDPPWPNRSASRKGDYSTIDRREIIPLLKKIPVADITKPRGLVAVWITNRPALRKQLLEQVAPTWGCDGIPEAEWTWVKVTEKGETVWDMESKMRKPYEVLLILRRNGEKGEKEVKVKNMVMVAVPEKHSRKPAVKGLIEKYLPENHKGAEIFGRNLTDGWFTWGDEAIKWNWDGHWDTEEKKSEVVSSV
ncbi:MT-A70, partial [Ascodesmis nigricans]